MKGIVIRNPWSWCITQAWRDPDAKTVENRSWTHPHRGDLAIIEGRALDHDALDHPLVQWCITGRPADPGVDGEWGQPWAAGRGAVVCVVDMWSVCDQSRDFGLPCDCGPWAVDGQAHHRYRDVRPVPEPVPVRGWQGIRDLPADVGAAVRAQIGGTP